MDARPIVFETGRTWSFDELPDGSIALDGAVRGPRIDAARRVYSFDHHEACVRHATSSTCEQVRDALDVGLDPRGLSIYANDVDADTALSLWLLLHPEALVGPGRDRLRRLVHRVGRLDALGPAAGRVPRLMPVLQPPPGQIADRPTLDRALEDLDAWWRGDPVPSPPPEPPSLGLWVEGGKVLQADVRDGFGGLYRRAPWGVLGSPAPRGTMAWTVGKASEFVDFDVPAFLAACSAREPGWGGGSTIGGAPRHSDGSRSRLDAGVIAGILAAVSRGERA